MSIHLVVFKYCCVQKLFVTGVAAETKFSFFNETILQRYNLIFSRVELANVLFVITIKAELVVAEDATERGFCNGFVFPVVGT